MESLGAFDMIVVGGGVNGAGIARNAVGRGLSVLLVVVAFVLMRPAGLFVTRERSYD